MAKWVDFGDGIYVCGNCGMPAGWAYPSLAMQTLSEYCADCGKKMENFDLTNRTPREKIRAHWIRKQKGAHQYFCSVCGGKESGPRVWCPRCGTRMDDGAWKKAWAVREAWKAKSEHQEDVIFLENDESKQA